MSYYISETDTLYILSNSTLQVIKDYELGKKMDLIHSNLYY